MVNIIVCAKQVVNVSEIKINPETKEVILKGAPLVMSDIDKNAVEEAIKIKEKLGGKITVLTVSDTSATENIRALLAMGADEAILVKTDKELDYFLLSKILTKGIEHIGNHDIIICGEASVDSFSGQVGPRIAEILGIPQITYSKKVTAEVDKITAERDVDDKIMTLESPYPVVLTVTKEINEPRLPNLMQILAASNKPINEKTLADIGAGDIESMEPKIKTVSLEGVSMSRKNIIYEENLEQCSLEVVDEVLKVGIGGA